MAIMMTTVCFATEPPGGGGGAVEGVDAFVTQLQAALHAIVSITGAVFCFIGIIAFIEAQSEQDPGAKSRGGKALGTGLAILVVGNGLVIAFITLVNANMT